MHTTKDDKYPKVVLFTRSAFRGPFGAVRRYLDATIFGAEKNQKITFTNDYYSR